MTERQVECCTQAEHVTEVIAPRFYIFKFCSNIRILNFKTLKVTLQQGFEQHSSNMYSSEVAPRLLASYA